MATDEFTLDLDTLTLGEMAAAETASGLDTSVLLRSSAYRLLVGVFVHRYRSSGKAPLWHELENLRVVDVSSSPSDSSPDSPGAKSSD